MKNLIWASIMFWILGVVCFSIAICLLIFTKKNKANIIEIVIGFAGVLFCFFVTLPEIKDMVNKEISSQIVILNDESHHKMLITNYICEDMNGKYCEFKLSDWQYQDYKMDKGSKYKIYYYKNSRVISKIEAI